MSPIIIIGAGAAGIAAGLALKGRGVDALILEARPRIGGRAHTDRAHFGVPIDLGCAWLHAADKNPWSQYARDNGFNILERSPDWRKRVGKDDVPAERARRLQREWEYNEKLIEAAAVAGRDVPVSEIIPRNELRPFWDAVMTWLMGVETEQVSSVDYARYTNSEVNWAVREGLGSVIAHAGAQLNIRTGTPVEAIRWSGPEVIVTTSEGSVTAKAVIVTIPTTVLAQGSLRFEPALPLKLQEAFDGVPLGVANKVFFEMEPGALPFQGSTHFVGTDRTSRTASYQVRPAGHELLLAYFGGSLARELEEQHGLAAFAREQLSEIFGSEWVRKIRRSHATAWSTDSYALGSYSAARPGCAHLREQLSVPLAERIFFAGEANSIEYYGTVLGAWRSAVETVDKLLRAVAL